MPFTSNQNIAGVAGLRPNRVIGAYSYFVVYGVAKARRALEALQREARGLGWRGVELDARLALAQAGVAAGARAPRG